MFDPLDLDDTIYAKSLLKAIRTPQYFQVVPVIVEVEPSVSSLGLESKILNHFNLPLGVSLPRYNMFSLSLPTRLLEDVASLDYVAKIHFDRPHFAFEGPMGVAEDAMNRIKKKIQDGWIPSVEALKVVNVPNLHREGYRGSDINAAVIDTGDDISHPQLIGRYSGIESMTGEASRDNQGHGTWCQSMLGGRYWQHPITKIEMMGVAPECNLYSAKVLSNIGSGMTSWIMKGIDWAVNQGAQVISMSLGSDGAEDEEEDPMVRQINALKETHPNTIPVVANGNSGPEKNTVGIPAVADNCIAVGAYSILTQDVAVFSSRGPTTQRGKIKPDIVAPGGNSRPREGIYSGTALGSMLDYADKMPADSASPLMGTSMATPLVAGIITLWQEYTGGKLTVDDIKKIFKTMSGRKKDNDWGYGLIDATWIENVAKGGE